MSGSSVIGTLSLVAVDPMENLIRDLPGPKYGDLRDRDLQHLATAILEIKRAYRLLASGFRTFDEEATRRQLKYPEASGDSARSLVALLEQYASLFALEDVDPAMYEEIRWQLEVLTQKLDQETARARDAQCQYESHSEDVRGFMATVHATVTALGQRFQMSQISRVSEFRKTLKRDKKKVASLRRRLSRDIRKNPHDYETNAQSPTVLNTLMEDTEDTIQGVLNRSDMISDLSRMIRVDTYDLKAKLNMLSMGGMKITEFYNLKLKITRNVYISLSETLRQYATAMLVIEPICDDSVVPPQQEHVKKGSCFFKFFSSCTRSVTAVG
ncbi:hypothetical protein C8Q70DRAFT_154601 [Cubamyces menziesii]|nr:hypothetical protein C8Q70DRAFT_154601 [Cubamyces menziesii]